MHHSLTALQWLCKTVIKFASIGAYWKEFVMLKSIYSFWNIKLLVNHTMPVLYWILVIKNEKIYGCWRIIEARFKLQYAHVASCCRLVWQNIDVLFSIQITEYCLQFQTLWVNVNNKKDPFPYCIDTTCYITSKYNFFYKNWKGGKTYCIY